MKFISSTRSAVSAGLSAVLLLSGVAHSAAVGIDASKSKVTATFKQIGVPVEGVFTKATGVIQFHAAKPEAYSASLQIDTAAFDLGMEDYNAEVRKKEWFDTKSHPQATFVSTSFKSLGGDRYQASGKLTIKGKSVDISFPVTIKPQAAATVFTGSIPVSRKVFAIGDAGWNEVVDDAVTVNFSIVQSH